MRFGGASSEGTERNMGLATELAYLGITHVRESGAHNLRYPVMKNTPEYFTGTTKS